jgi:hypothetical protein
MNTLQHLSLMVVHDLYKNYKQFIKTIIIQKYFAYKLKKIELLFLNLNE